MYEQIVFSGFGGQGIQSMSKMLSQCAIAVNLLVSWMPAYGGAMRGGTSNVTVIVSDEAIASPMPERGEVTAVVAMNVPSLVKFADYLRPGGLLLVNESLVDITPVRQDIKVLLVPANEMADHLGNVRAANMIMLGCLLEKTGVVKPEVLAGLMDEFFAGKPHLITFNRQAFWQGVQWCRDYQKGEEACNV